MRRGGIHFRHPICLGRFARDGQTRKMVHQNFQIRQALGNLPHIGQCKIGHQHVQREPLVRKLFQIAPDCVGKALDALRKTPQPNAHIT